MSSMRGPRATAVASPRLRELLQRHPAEGPAGAESEAQGESPSRRRGQGVRAQRSGASTPDREQPAGSDSCDLCGGPIDERHDHLLDLESRELLCACRACSLLFDRKAAGGGHFVKVGDRRLALVDLDLPDAVWEELRIPVDMAFFFHNSREGRVMAYYPSPMGPTESLLGLEAWDGLERANPILGEMEPDVEALLVNRARGARGHWLVPIDECYALIGLIRTHWKGLSGGSEVWEEVDRFFERLDERSTVTSRTGSAQASSAPSGAAERR